MPPPLALFLCLGFVIVLLRLDHRQSASVSVSLWVPTIWLIYSSSKPLATWFGGGGSTIEEGSSLDRVFLIGLLLWGLWILNRRGFQWGSVIIQHGWFTVLFGYMLVSVVWSDIPFISFKRWMRELVALVMAVMVATEYNPPLALAVILRRFAYILVPVSWLLIKYYPAFGVQYGRWSGKQMWIGAALQKNGLGLLSLVAAFCLIWKLFRRWRDGEPTSSKYQNHVDLVVLGLALWLLKGPPNAYSATSVATLILGLLLFGALWWLQLKRKVLQLWLLVFPILFIIVVGACTPFLGGSNLTGVSGALGRDSTLTGRTDIWAGLVPEAERHPILGWGFGGFWTSEMVEEHMENSSHSGYLDTLLQLGSLGMLLTTAFLIACCLQARSLLREDFDFGALWISFLIMTLAHNVTESSLGSFTSPLTAILIFFAISYPSVLRQRQSVARHFKSDVQQPSTSQVSAW